MNRQAYNACMKPYMTGSQTREERQRNMCIGAKLCTGRAATVEEAKKICDEAPPKPPRVPGTRRASGKTCSPQAISTVAACLVRNTNFNPTKTNLEEELKIALSQCMCGKEQRRLSKAEQAVLQLDPEQRQNLIQFMREQGTEGSGVEL